MPYLAGLLFLANVAFFTYQFAFRPPSPVEQPAPPSTLERVSSAVATIGAKPA